MKKLVLTGAAGALGSQLRAPLAAMCDEFVSSDLVDSIDNLGTNETYVKADVADLAAMEALLKDATMVIHFGAIADEAPWDDILQSNIIGAYNVWEAAHRNGVKRVVYASSVHAVGMHLKTDTIGLDVPHRPDTYYGLAKCFAEDLASLYWDKRGIESVCLRIFSAAPPSNARAIGTWLSTKWWASQLSTGFPITTAPWWITPKRDTLAIVLRIMLKPSPKRSLQHLSLSTTRTRHIFASAAHLRLFHWVNLVWPRSKR